MRRLSTILIILGILVISYPFASRLYTSYWNQRLLNQLDITETIQTSYELLNDFFYNEVEFIDEALIEDVEEEEIEEEIVNSPSEAAKAKRNLIGTIEIEKINLRLPILQGTSATNLKRAAGHLDGTNFPGEIGNSVIAAHRGRSYGILFNRLDELEIGDKIMVKTNSGPFQYTVYEIKVVDPTDLSVLKRSNEHRVLTLITCTPIQNATHRLIVHAKMLTD